MREKKGYPSMFSNQILVWKLKPNLYFPILIPKLYKWCYLLTIFSWRNNCDLFQAQHLLKFSHLQINGSFKTRILTIKVLHFLSIQNVHRSKMMARLVEIQKLGMEVLFWSRTECLRDIWFLKYWVRKIEFGELDFYCLCSLKKLS